MAIYRLEAKIHGRRSKDAQGKPRPETRLSILAKAAYRSGERLRDAETEQVFNYRSRAQEIVHTEIVAPESAPSWVADRETLWNRAQAMEKRKDAQLAREFILALPRELDDEQQARLVRGWCGREIAAHGLVADVAIHRSRDGANPHAHVLATLRPLEGEWFGKKAREQNGVEVLVAQRQSWEQACNAALEEAGSTARVDCRSLADQGLDREPQPKIGPEATALERRGARTERGDLAAQVALENFMAPARAELRAEAEAERRGNPAASGWWERAGIAAQHWYEQAQALYARAAERAHDFLYRQDSGGRMDWRGFIEAQRDVERPGIEYE